MLEPLVAADEAGNSYSGGFSLREPLPKGTTLTLDSLQLTCRPHIPVAYAGFNRRDARRDRDPNIASIANVKMFDIMCRISLCTVVLKTQPPLFIITLDRGAESESPESGF